jgi:hypothetical protein
MIVSGLHKAGELVAVLAEPTAGMRLGCGLLSKERCAFPAGAPSSEGLENLSETLTEQIGCLGHHLVALLKEWARSGRAGALDSSTVLWAKGDAVWHNSVS